MSKIVDPIAYAWERLHELPLPKELLTEYGKALSKGTGPRGTGRKPTGSTFVSNPEKGITR